MVRYSGIDLDHVATCAFAFVLQTRAFGIQLFQPRHYTLRISATFHQCDEVLYSAVDFAETPRSSAIGLNAMAVAPKCFPPKRTRASRTGRPRALAGSQTTIAQEALATDGSAAASKGLQTPAMVPAIRDWNPQALDALFGVVQDATANPKARRKAALKIAEFLLPKAAKKAKVIPDEYGFLINPNLASAYRDIHLELRALVNGPTRKIPAIAEKIKNCWRVPM